MFSNTSASTTIGRDRCGPLLCGPRALRNTCGSHCHRPPPPRSRWSCQRSDRRGGALQPRLQGAPASQMFFQPCLASPRRPCVDAIGDSDHMVTTGAVTAPPAGCPIEQLSDGDWDWQVESLLAGDTHTHRGRPVVQCVCSGVTRDPDGLGFEHQGLSVSVAQIA